jgi:hypothetical protein
VTVLGFAQTLRSGDGLWVLSGLGTAVFFLVAAWQRHAQAMAASAVLLALAVLGGLLAHFHVSARAAEPSASAAAPAMSSASAAAPAAPTAGSAVAGAAGATAAGAAGAGATAAAAPAGTSPARVIEVTLPRHAAVDLDSGAQPAVIGGQIGATGLFDLYHDAGEVMSDVIRTPNGMYTYPAGTSPESAYAVCSDYTSPNPSTNAYEPSAGVDTGNAFCFRTTEGNLAWATVEAVQPITDTAVLKVLIWT